MFRDSKLDDPEISPEKVWGSDFQVLEIEGEGSSRGFNITGLNLPKAWSDFLPLREFNKDRLHNFYNSICQEYGYRLLTIEYDKNNIAKEFAVQRILNSSISRLYLSSDIPFIEKGEYVTDNLDTPDATYLLQYFGAQYLGLLTNSFKYAHIVGSKTGYDSYNLAIPERLFRSNKNLANNYYQEYFLLEASNIAGRFGLKLDHCYFDDRGLLTSVGVQGDRCDYSLLGQQFYSSHNVDTPYQAFALHTIAARYINRLLTLEISQRE